jgi:hypothetical protein
VILSARRLLRQTTDQDALLMLALGGIMLLPDLQR